jgi:hypothetical protein
MHKFNLYQGIRHIGLLIYPRNLSSTKTTLEERERGRGKEGVVGWRERGNGHRLVMLHFCDNFMISPTCSISMLACYRDNNVEVTQQRRPTTTIFREECMTYMVSINTCNEDTKHVRFNIRNLDSQHARW